MEMTDEQVIEFTVTDSQQRIIDLIKTWEPKNISLAIELDRSQQLGVSEIYKSFLGEINIWGELDDKYKFFPIESCMFERCYTTSYEKIPSKFKTLEDVIFYIKKWVLLFGRNKHFVLIQHELYEHIDWTKVLDIINSYYNQEDFLIIEDLPF